MNNPLANLLASGQDFFARLFDNTGKSVLGVDIGSSSIKVVQLKRKGGRALLETYGELALGPYAGFQVGQATNLSDEKLGEAIRDIVREANVTTRDAGFAIPLAASLVTVVHIPTVSGEDLKTMVPIEARRYIPVPISEVALDFRVIPEEAGGESHNEEVSHDSSREGVLEKRGRTKVLIAAIHNETINRFESIAKKSGLEVSFLEIETFSSMRSLLGRETGSVLIVDIGAGATKASIIDRGVIAGTHIINRGSQDVTVALSQAYDIDIAKAELLKREIGLTGDGSRIKEVETVNLIIASIFAEVNTMVFEYEKKHHKIIEKVILSGGGALLTGIREAAEKSFGTRVLLADPFSKVESPAFLEGVLRNAGPNFAVATGIALRKLQELT